MAFDFIGFSGARTVLILTDEALFVYTATRRQVQLVETLDWTNPALVERLTSLLTQECRSQPVILLNDMVEQHYRKERIPRVASMDKKMIVTHRLNMMFADHQYRSFLPPQGDESKTKKRSLFAPKNETLPQDVYLFAAFPENEAIKAVMQAIQRAFVSIIGFGLLPVESASMINALVKRLLPAPTKKAGVTWTVFLGQQSSGGLRQIVTKNNEFALTRITPILDTDLNPSAWVKDVAREFQSTLGYLTRFGLSPQDELNVIVIAGEKSHSFLHQNLESYTNLVPLTLESAAAKLGLNIGQQVEQRYADLLHAGWQGRHRGLAMPMRAKILDALSGPRRLATFAGYGLLIAYSGMMFYGAHSILTYYQSKTNLDLAEEQKQQISQIYEQDMARKTAVGIDFKLVRGALDANKDILAKAAWPYPVLRAVAAATDTQLRLVRLDLTTAPVAKDQLPAASAPDGNGKRDKLTRYTLTYEFPKEMNADEGNKKVAAVRAQIAQLLPDYTVTIPKPVTDLSFLSAVTNERTQAGVGTEITDYKIDVVISQTGGAVQ
ncbi:MAG: hypothetical protein V4621_07105 [Pseudomonadota bacterium]